ncbi:MAG: hypothetical protein K0S11_148 [Gammaproteobacteria bacterium]|jgi:hypothetical protein|nr:hypothetical protein [Gammaproteobacteria bacterium]
MDIHAKGYRIIQWKKFLKRLLVGAAFILQLLHIGQQLASLKHPAHTVSHSQQVVFLLKQCFNFNCQLMVSFGSRSRKVRRKNSQ